MRRRLPDFALYMLGVTLLHGGFFYTADLDLRPALAMLAGYAVLLAHYSLYPATWRQPARVPKRVSDFLLARSAKRSAKPY